MVRIDVSRIEGTRRICDTDAAASIREMLAGIPLSGAHFLGSGDYHYLTLFQLERISEPFALILFDNHTDQQESLFGPDILSCGNWVLHARKLPMLKDFVYISDNSRFRKPDGGLPVYVSVDLDILSEEYADTNWNQGTMSTDELCSILSQTTAGRRLIGIDFCGAPENNDDCELNRKAIGQISKTALG